MTAQSERPNTRANVASSVPLGSGELPGCVWIQIRANSSGRRPASTCSIKEFGHRIHRRIRPCAQVQRLRDELAHLRRTADRPAPRSRIRRSPFTRITQKQQLGPGRGAEPQHRAGGEAPGSFLVFERFFFMAIGAPFMFVEAAGANARAGSRRTVARQRRQ